MVMKISNLLGAKAHMADRNNPHGVTAEQIGLEKVQNLPVATTIQQYKDSAGGLYPTVWGVGEFVDGELDPIKQAIQNIPTLPSFASNAAALTGTSTNTLLNPANLKYVLDSRIPSVPPFASESQMNEGTATNVMVNPAGLTKYLEANAAPALTPKFLNTEDLGELVSLDWGRSGYTSARESTNFGQSNSGAIPAKTIDVMVAGVSEYGIRIDMIRFENYLLSGGRLGYSLGGSWAATYPSSATRNAAFLPWWKIFKLPRYAFSNRCIGFDPKDYEIRTVGVLSSMGSHIYNISKEVDWIDMAAPEDGYYMDQDNRWTDDNWSTIGGVGEVPKGSRNVAKLDYGLREKKCIALMTGGYLTGTSTTRQSRTFDVWIRKKGTDIIVADFPMRLGARMNLER
tara:strand:- start:40256 stop:41452 length:1197 start_codon:yes stop_codon:yes gene_type:complete